MDKAASTLGSVSVVIPAYNAAGCIERAIRSALDQSLAPVEVIVVDDGSSDGTFDLVSRLSSEERRIKPLRQPVNSGPAAARNLGMRSACGDWIAILDADDAFVHDRLRYLVEAAERRDLTFAADNIALFDLAAGRTVRLAIDPDVIGPCLDLDRYDFARNCMPNRPGAVDFGPLKPIMRRSFLTASGVAYPEDARQGEDFIFYLRALMAGARFSVFPEPLYIYSQRVGSLSYERSHLSRTTVNHPLMEEQTRALALEPAIRADPVLASLLLARAERIKAISTRRRLRDLLRRRDFVELARQFVGDNHVREVVSASLRRKLLKRLSVGGAGS